MLEDNRLQFVGIKRLFLPYLPGVYYLHWVSPYVWTSIDSTVSALVQITLSAVIAQQITATVL